MSSESELRDAMRSSTNIPTAGIDTADVLRRARARRVPKQVAFSSLSALAVVGVVALGINTLPALQAGQGGASLSSVTGAAPESSADDAGSGSSAKSFATNPLAVSMCGSPTSVMVPNSAGLVLSVAFPESSLALDTDVAGTVTLTNTGTSSVSGTTAIAPIVIVSRDGITVWHTDRAMIAVVVDIHLEPGQSHSFDAYFTPVECEPQDDANGMFRDNLPVLTPGPYEVSGELFFVPSDSESGENVLVGGPAQTIELR